jgi:hypothetical protein
MANLEYNDFRRCDCAWCMVLPDKLGLDFPEPQRIHFILSRFDNGAETLSRPMCAEGVL